MAKATGKQVAISVETDYTKSYRTMTFNKFCISRIDENNVLFHFELHSDAGKTLDACSIMMQSQDVERACQGSEDYFSRMGEELLRKESDSTISVPRDLDPDLSTAKVMHLGNDGCGRAEILFVFFTFREFHEAISSPENRKTVNVHGSIVAALQSHMSVHTQFVAELMGMVQNASS